MLYSVLFFTLYTGRKLSAMEPTHIVGPMERRLAAGSNTREFIIFTLAHTLFIMHTILILGHRSKHNV
jgi:hypothetical protein